MILAGFQLFQFLNAAALFLLYRYLIPMAVVAFYNNAKAQNHSAIKVMPHGYKITPALSPNLFDATASIKKWGNGTKPAILKQDGMPCVIPLTINTTQQPGKIFEGIKQCLIFG